MNIPAILRTCSLLPLAASLAPAQGGQWERSYPKVEPTLIDATMLSGVEGYAVASQGTLRHTTNGGIFWTDAAIPSQDVRAISFKASFGWAVGDGIYKSTDGGQLWQQKSLATDLNDVFFVNANAGYAVGAGSQVLATTDAGESWSSVNIAGVSENLLSVHFLSATTGWVAGENGTHYVTNNGGASWQALVVPTSAHLLDVHYADSTHGWLSSGDHIWRTSDGGMSWSSATLPGAAFAKRISVLGTNWIWATGPAGVIVHSSNGGVSFSEQSTTGTALHDISMGDLTTGIAVGAEGSIYRTANGGTSWELVAGGGSSSVPLVWEIDQYGADLVWATTTDSIILRSEDAGANWQEIPAGLPQTAYRALDFFDALHGFAVGERQGFYPTVAWTSDGGLTWNPTYQLGMYDYWDVDAVSTQSAVACADNGLWRTTDGGFSWNFINTVPLSSLYGADFLDSNLGWAVGWDIFRTSDGGATWTHLRSTSELYFDVSFADAQHGWAVGMGGAILATQDGGSTWVAQDVGAALGALYTVEALSPSVAWVAGSNGFVARTSDGGQNWMSLPPADAAGSEFWGSYFDGNNSGWLTGYYPNPGIWRREASLCQWSNYCSGKLHSQGKVAKIDLNNEPSIAQSPLQIVVRDGVTNKPGILIASDAGRAETPFFGGFLCLAAPISRFAPHFADGTGLVRYDVALQSSMVGQTQWFQFWQRDPANSDGTGVALSDALEVTYCE